MNKLKILLIYISSNRVWIITLACLDLFFIFLAWLANPDYFINYAALIIFVFAGGEERIVLAVAKRVAKELNKVGYVSVRSIVKITAEKLNQIDLSEQAGKIAGGCMLVTDAAELTKESVEKLKAVMEQEDEKVVVMLAGPFDEMDCFLDIYPDLAEKLVYKVRM